MGPFSVCSELPRTVSPKAPAGYSLLEYLAVSTDRIKKAIRAGWDDMSESYQAETQISLEDVHYGPISPGERDLRLMGDVSGKRVLELACGAAQNSIALAKWGAHPTALDFSMRQLEVARTLVAQEGVDVDLIQGDMETLGVFRAGVFDIVVSSHGWEFLPDLAACFAECSRVLNRDGLLVVCTVHPLAAFEWDEGGNALKVTDYFSPPVEVWGESAEQGNSRAMTYFHTVQEVFETLAGCGLSVERLLEPYPYPLDLMGAAHKRAIPYSSSYWERQYQRFRRVPFTIIYVARKLK